MVRSEAQKRADAKYQKNKVINKSIKFIKGVDDELIEYISSLDNFSLTVKGLLKKEMKKK